MIGMRVLRGARDPSTDISVCIGLLCYTGTHIRALYTSLVKDQSTVGFSIQAKRARLPVDKLQHNNSLYHTKNNTYPPLGQLTMTCSS